VSEAERAPAELRAFTEVADAEVVLARREEEDVRPSGMELYVGNDLHHLLQDPRL